MTIAERINKEVIGWTGVGMAVVIASIVLLNFKGDTLCTSGYTYNATADNCYLATNSSVTQSVGGLGSTIDKFVAAFAEPSNWVGIVIIAIIGIALLGYFTYKKMSK